MIVLPAIDIFKGKCVRLTKGDFKTAKVYSADPLAMAKKFEKEGAQMLHIVDLDAAKIGRPQNEALIINMAKTAKIPIEVGGGIRDIKTARNYLNAGIQRIVIGTKALTEPGLIRALIKEFGNGRVVVALEIKDDKIAIKGWQETADKNYLAFAKELKDSGITQILFTDVSRDGSLTEPNFKVIEELIGLGFNLTASGGISSLKALEKLKKLKVFGAVLGKALYENKIDLKNAMESARPKSGLTKRIIPCLDVKSGKVVKGVRFKNHKIAGGIVELARRYCDEGADELVFYDITASAQARAVSIDWVRRAAEVINIPFCAAGGINSVKGARIALQSGADKISINSPALANPNLINLLAREFGSQCVVVGIDSFEQNGGYFVKQYAGNPAKTKTTKWRTFDWALEAQKRGAGEIVLNCMNKDGVRGGYDIAQLKALRKALAIPLIASGGAGSLEDFRNVFARAEADGALAASVFHSGDISIPQLKTYLSANNIPVRP